MKETLNSNGLASVARVMDLFDQRVLNAQLGGLEPLPTGFDPLDRWLGGGLKPGELTIISGAQGVGKTMMAFQMARNVAQRGAGQAIYICYEHDAIYMVTRLIAMETLVGRYDHPDTALRHQHLEREILSGRRREQTGLYQILARHQSAAEAMDRIKGYGERFQILKGSSHRTGIESLQKLVQRRRAVSEVPLVLFVDYLQKIPVEYASFSENDRLTRVTEDLKEMALEEGVAVVAISAAEKEGLQAKRLHLYHLRGPAALAYEADVVLVLNDKYHIVAKTNIEYNPHRAQSFKDWVICSLEKNRSGVSDIDLEFRKCFEFCCFNPRGDLVSEKLIEGRLYTE